MATPDAAPLLALSGVWRSYPSGDLPIDALKATDLTIHAGEMVAIIGQSGSGKSTLMNILGCLDQPTKGTYRVAGRDVRRLSPDERAALRREHFGFIFQRYHLLPDLDARRNVEVPAVYAGLDAKARRLRSTALLQRLGLGERLGHRPSQLSGGQQQRVSIARALMNGGQVILADEPTGALDTKSGAEMMAILKSLNAEGHTVILVTHDPLVADHARRIIELRDGEVVSDRPNGVPVAVAPRAFMPLPGKDSWRAIVDRFGEATGMALLAMNAHRLRTMLTMLGVVIGIASVITILSIVGGAEKSVVSGVGSLGADTVSIFPGSGAGDERATRVRSLTPADVALLSDQSYVDSVSPTVAVGRVVRAGAETGLGSVTGVGDQYFRTQNLTIARGRGFDAAEVEAAAQMAVIDDKTATRLFGSGDPLGQVVLLGAVPVRVVGVTGKAEGLAAIFSGSTLQVWTPYTTVMTRLVRQPDVSQITVRLADGESAAAAEKAIVVLLKAKHGRQDFYVLSSDTFRQQLGQITLVFSAVFGSIGGIALLVGGIGVMNIMLVSVSERTREIGVRTAIGARQSDIMSQFMIEAVLVCLIGGAVGVGLSMAASGVFSLFVKSFELVYSPISILAAFGTATMIGLVFGWLPARNAAALDPVDALARE